MSDFGGSTIACTGEADGLLSETLAPGIPDLAAADVIFASSTSPSSTSVVVGFGVEAPTELSIG
jgi:hypothetical protein